MGAEAGAVAGFAAGVAAGAAVGVGFAAGAADGVEAVGVDASAAVAFDLEDFFAVVAVVSPAAGAAAESGVSDFLLFLDFAVVELPLAVVVVSADASAFFDLEDFFAVEESAGVEDSAATSAFFDFEVFFVVDESPVVELSAVSAFLDFEDFLAVELSAVVAESAVADFLVLEDFFAVEVSAAAVSSAVGVFFFFLDLAAAVSPWSVVAGVCAACAADAGRRVRLANTTRRATSREK